MNIVWYVPWYHIECNSVPHVVREESELTFFPFFLPFFCLIIDYPGTIFAQIFAQRSSIHLKVHDFLNLVEKKEAERMVHLGVLFDSVVRFFVFVVNACVQACVFFWGVLFQYLK